MRIRYTLGAALLAAALALAAAGASPGPQATPARAPATAASAAERNALELAKLEAEIAKLRVDAAAVAPWYATPLASGAAVLVGFLGVIVTGLLGLRTALSTRVHAFDTRLFEARLEAYGALLAPTRAFALHFPERIVDQPGCAEVGRELRQEYFGLAGTLMTVQARRRYMTLQLLLTRAARAARLCVPGSDDDYANWIDEQKIDRYRDLLGFTQGEAGEPDEAAAEAEMAACRDHIFGEALAARGRADAGPEGDAAQRFRDFVTLQFAASRLRTELGRDVSARRPIGDLRLPRLSAGGPPRS